MSHQCQKNTSTHIKFASCYFSWDGAIESHISDNQAFFKSVQLDQFFSDVYCVTKWQNVPFYVRRDPDNAHLIASPDFPHNIFMNM